MKRKQAATSISAVSLMRVTMKILLCFCVEVLDVMMKLQIGTLSSVLVSLFKKLIGTCKLKNGDLWDGMGLTSGYGCRQMGTYRDPTEIGTQYRDPNQSAIFAGQ